MKRFIHHIPPYLPTALVLVAILYISLAPDPMPDEIPLLLFPGADKLIHFIMYGGLAGTFCFDYYRRGSSAHERGVLIAATLVAIAIGGAIELTQDYMGIGRRSDYLDFIANSAGAIVGTIAGAWAFRRRNLFDKE